MEPDKKDSAVDRIIQNLTRAATIAADEVSEVLQSAAQTAGEKHDIIKLRFELATLREEQTKTFAQIGRYLFLVRSGRATMPDAADDTDFAQDAEAAIARLLVEADQQQQGISLAAENLARLTGGKTCPICEKPAPPKDIFCSACGAKLPENPAE